jgi:hypothetical protein
MNLIINKNYTRTILYNDVLGTAKIPKISNKATLHIYIDNFCEIKHKLEGLDKVYTEALAIENDRGFDDEQR